MTLVLHRDNLYGMTDEDIMCLIRSMENSQTLFEDGADVAESQVDMACYAPYGNRLASHRLRRAIHPIIVDVQPSGDITWVEDIWLALGEQITNACCHCLAGKTCVRIWLKDARLLLVEISNASHAFDKWSPCLPELVACHGCGDSITDELLRTHGALVVGRDCRTKAGSDVGDTRFICLIDLQH